MLIVIPNPMNEERRIDRIGLTLSFRDQKTRCAKLCNLGVRQVRVGAISSYHIKKYVSKQDENCELEASISPYSGANNY
ncbi:hypothetical protein Ahy_A07g030993 isoform D [Arachis hypogaea]|uniref:Uncharacterized protein n=1 Tax=Arachis hypogaea TaxID=3818 RepID=A0A445C2H7_ARAHY|nr:hypothetical protein Ahy_A07g030993 isoform D [Arachis hypogaea]